MLTAILCGWLRHGLSGMGGALVSYGIHFIGTMPIVHNVEAVVLGGVALALSGAASTLQKVKTESGPIYKTNV